MCFFFISQMDLLFSNVVGSSTNHFLFLCILFSIWQSKWGVTTQPACNPGTQLPLCLPLLQVKKDKEVVRVNCSLLGSVRSADSSRPTWSFELAPPRHSEKKKKRHERESCRCQLVMTRARRRAEGRAAPFSRADCRTWGGDEWRGLFSTCQPSLPFTLKRSCANHGIKYTWKTHFHHFSSLTNTS